jgi:hypothetical protein
MPSTFIEGALRTHIRANTGVSALIADRFYVIEAPQGVVEPYAVMFMVSADNNSITLCHNDGAEPTFQINVFTRGHDEGFQAITIGNKIIDSIQNYNGTMDGMTVDLIKCRGVQVIRDEEEEDIFQGIIEFTCKYIR